MGHGDKWVIHRKQARGVSRLFLFSGNFSFRMDYDNDSSGW